MKNFDRRFNFMHRLISGIIVAGFALIALYWLVIGFIAYNAVDAVSNQDWSNGAKPVIESLWCGKPGCTNLP